MKKIGTFFIFLLSIPSISYAEINCDNAKTQYSMEHCEKIKMDKLKTELDKILLSIKSRLRNDNEAKDSFMKAQEAWDSFTDKECLFQIVRGGSIRAQAYTFCKNNLTKQRIKDLGYYLHCKEGDLTCPVPSK